MIQPERPANDGSLGATFYETLRDKMSEELPFPVEMPKHRVYELVVKQVVGKLEPGASVRHDVDVPVVGDDRVRQVDVYVEGRIAGFPFTVVIDCKHYSKPLNVKDVDEFIGMLDDIRPNMGVLVSLNGFGSGARKRAAKEGRRLNLCSVFAGGHSDFSAPIGIGIISVERSDLEVRARFQGGASFVGPISRNLDEWNVVDSDGERWTVLDLVAKALNTDRKLADLEAGTCSVSADNFKMFCADGSEQTFAKLEIDFRSRLKFFRKASRFDTGVAILDGEGAVIAQANLGVSVRLPVETADWEEISAADAKGGTNGGAFVTRLPRDIL